MRTILVIGYFGADESDSKLEYFRRLNRALAAHNRELILLNLNRHRIKTEVRSESLPLLIEKSHKLPLNRLLPLRGIAPEAVHAASIDAACWRRSPEREQIRVLLFREYLRTLILRERPGLVIAWHQFFGLNYTLPAMLKELGVPFLFAEFGPLPGTVIYDEGGQMAESPIARESAAFAALPVSDADLQNAARFVAQVRQERRTRKPQQASGAVREALRERHSRASRVVFYAGQYDCRTGMLPRTLPNATLHSPFFAGTLDALSFLSRLAKANGWLILFKPHPLARNEGGLPIDEPNHVISVPGASIYDCFDHAETSVTIVSQVSYMSLIYGRPCVMLGRNYLTGKGCTYDPSSREAIVSEIQASLERGVTGSQKSMWIKHVAQLLKHAVFAFDGDLQAEGLRTDDQCAAYLAGLCAADGIRESACRQMWTHDAAGPDISKAGLKTFYRVATALRPSW
jgi:hypothetical protein